MQEACWIRLSVSISIWNATQPHENLLICYFIIKCHLIMQYEHFKNVLKIKVNCFLPGKRLSLVFVDCLWTETLFYFWTGVEILMFAHSGNINNGTAKWLWICGIKNIWYEKYRVCLPGIWRLPVLLRSVSPKGSFSTWVSVSLPQAPGCSKDQMVEYMWIPWLNFWHNASTSYL